MMMLLAATGCHACTSIIFGSASTTNGDIFIARNADSEGTTDTNNYYVHAPLASPAIYRSNVNRLQVRLPAGSLGYTSFPAIAADTARGVNATSESNGVNTAGVALSATETIYNSHGALGG